MSLSSFIAPRSHLLQQYTSCRTMFLCCDIQEKLRKRIPKFNNAVVVSNLMADFHDVLTPKYATFVATEHAPELAGPFVKDIRLPAGTHIMTKYQPSMLLPDVSSLLEGDEAKGVLPVRQAVLWGHESHVCILHTADALLQRNIRVAVLVDGCAAQHAIDHEAAVQTMASWDGLTLSTIESVVMQLTQNDHAMVKDLWKLLRTRREQLA
ncbi:putative mitochondrial associated ribonuclease [Leptomonas pyrrhocoris]|uniref:Putative mitochondrial associated ribonuclease n=1 Tax=Leptomonas pyrrhocoris TaxID=157538 RepID=A0A0N1J4A8_LEPPY|nr:putative mitochondrial associated ribonuclease [Leptomonas pyrrhocoris]XP_015653196.1 putative mitochondrial associated ribonuclease [Leptomonas pyrrhocoris]XP_015653197.1 putative mitochondrial associated ribonuclease [Leptomonas pyrrhocoris]XP_015653198.1 putative mitochondrial associated ribonuclease [Leptomonas pyrrhocoris]KPA74756.1 putative mitochondrial associated ribonuclease [Leptomonas pyrrhocoris]KPA74757.1 putative mitochondrial associated ribonuclease [Leptomonas pyrrhocoris]K|eukprot:XP_015653195.1 putative mitochondrial associated ribonuclease [Leptomonas pyrrhocoris]